MTERDARARWGHVAEPGDRVAHMLIDELGAATAFNLIAAGPSVEDVVTLITSIPRDDVEQNERVSRDIERALGRWRARIGEAHRSDPLSAGERQGVRYLIPSDDAWPRQMNDLGEYAPLGLWVRGDVSALTMPGVAVVGARKSTDYGEHCATELVAGLVPHGLSIISGAAFGIDRVAHRTALVSGGVTVAFLAGGVDRPYPKAHEEMIDQIAQVGAVVSELPCGAQPSKWRFLQRNRLIAALAAATVVVEAGQRSGSLNTVAHAATIGRPYGAVPGPITSALSAGCHRLYRERDAVCVTSVEQIIELAGYGGPCELTMDAADPRETRILDALSARRGRSSREVATRSGLPIDEVRALLGLLAVDGTIVENSDGWRFSRRL